MTHIMRIDELKSSTYRSAADKRESQLNAMPASIKRKLPKDILEMPQTLRDFADKRELEEERERFNKLSKSDKIKYKWDFLKKLVTKKRNEICSTDAKYKGDTKEEPAVCVDGSPMYIWCGRIQNFGVFLPQIKAKYLYETFDATRVIFSIYHRNGSFDIRGFIGISLSDSKYYRCITRDSVRENASLSSIERMFNDFIKEFLYIIRNGIETFDEQFFKDFAKYSNFKSEKTEKYDDESKDHFAGGRSYAASVSIQYKYIDYYKIKHLPKVLNCTQQQVTNFFIKNFNWDPKDFDWNKGYYHFHSSHYEYWD